VDDGVKLCSGRVVALYGRHCGGEAVATTGS
jgi:hypothetical protein